MFKLTLIVALFAFAAAVPVRVEEDNSIDSTKAPEVIAILKSESTQNEDGSYNFLYESSDGSFREENAEIVNLGSEESSGIKITGSYKYIDANGDEVVVTYTADENGFVPVGTNINKEISDAAIAARNLPKQEEEPERKPVGRSLTVDEPVKKVIKPKPKPVEKPEVIEKVIVPTPLPQLVDVKVVEEEKVVEEKVVEEKPEPEVVEKIE